jgi:hypothetical protein
MCQAASYQYRMNNRVFWNRDIDIDLQPQNYAVLDHVDKSFHPPLYYMWYCPECHFTAGYRHFIHPLKDVYVKVDAVAKRIREAYANDKPFRQTVKLLVKGGVDVERMDFFMGLRLHLLALRELELIEDMVKQYFLNLGRYCLHLAWLYRDLEKNPEEKQNVQPRLDELAEELREVWPKMPCNEYEALSRAADYYDQTFERSPQVRTVIDEVSILQVIARIYIKLDKQTEARKLINNSIGRAKEAKAHIDAKLHDLESTEGKQLTAEETGDMVTLSRRLRTIMDEGKRLIQILTDQRIKEHIHKAKKLIKQHKGKERIELRRILAKHKIDKRVINKLIPPPRKKGLFDKLSGK